MHEAHTELHVVIFHQAPPAAPHAGWFGPQFYSWCLLVFDIFYCPLKHFPHEHVGLVLLPHCLDSSWHNRRQGFLSPENDWDLWTSDFVSPQRSHDSHTVDTQIFFPGGCLCGDVSVFSSFEFHLSFINVRRNKSTQLPEHFLEK